MSPCPRREQVGRCRAPAPAGQGLPDPPHQGVRGDELPARRQQPVQPPGVVRQRTRRQLLADAAPRRLTVQHALGGPGEFGAEHGHGVAFHRRTPRETDVQQLPYRRPRPVAPHQIGTAPPGGPGPAYVRGDPEGVLFEGVEPAARDQPDERTGRGRGDRVAQRPCEQVLGDVQRRLGGLRVPGARDGRFLGALVAAGREAAGRGAAVRGGSARLRERLPAQRLPAPQRPPGRPAGPRVPYGRRAAQALHERHRVGAQHRRAGRAVLVLAVALVEHDRRDLLGAERQAEREPDRAGADDDHRIHGVTPGAGRSGRRRAAVVRYVITERMQPTARACVK